MSDELGMLQADTADEGPALSPLYREQVFAIIDAELRKVMRDPTEIFSRAVQPMLWLFVFGQVFGKLRDIPTGGVSYLAFMIPGILSQSILFSAIFYGISAIWEKDMGIVHKLLVSPVPRSALILGKAFSSGFRSLAQASLIYIATLFLGVGCNYDLFHILGVMMVVMLGSAIFSTFSLIIASLVKSRERFMGIGQVLTMPLFFASNAIYPVEMMPDWLKVVARINPMTYMVHAMRTLMIRGGQSVEGLGTDCMIMVLIFVLLVLVAKRIYPNLVR
ncbi:MAG: ABC transporter permease [Aminobacteriaceae bacterium]|jgi:ABC-2 type transport system permease protein